MQQELQFKISSALKNIIGSDLINDDFIAVFELVKNSYDAHATQVEVIFENISPKIIIKDGVEVIENNAKIIIKDNGKGMNYDDLINKWLFVAYSAKKEGTEEDTYRDKIKVKRAYAGAKGIGRFSCDRLGQNLYLETIKDDKYAKVEVLVTDWGKFEGDIKEEFINISVLHDTISKSNYDVNHGTVLEITNLKSEWNREKLLRLKDALAKLVNPVIHNQGDTFLIELDVPDELQRDNEYSDYRDIVNGKIENRIFEVLDLKTAKITSKITDNEKGVVETTLFEGGKMVYRIKEHNLFTNLTNVECEIYFLNRSAKLTFSRRMGVDAVAYGHVFLYKNGLRIYPYGERGEDPFKMDNRKAQGYNRYLGTREVIGFISISEPNNNLRETSSRGDGLIKNEAYFDLYEWFFTSIKRLEKFNLDITDWGNELSNDDYIQLDNTQKQIALESLLNSLTKSKNIISFEVAPEIFKILDKKQEGSVKNIISNITQKIANEDFDTQKIIEELKEYDKKVTNLRKNKEEAEEEAFDKLIKNESLSNNLEIEKKRGAFQGALIGTDKQRIVGLQHQVHRSSGRISWNVKLLLNYLNPDLIDEKTKKYLKIISLEASKINSIAKFVTKANFNMEASEIETDVVDFIKDYLTEIYILEDSTIKTDLKISIKNEKGISFTKEIRPLEITTILDNLISNAEKANAQNLTFRFSNLSDKLQIEVIDDGKGISNEIINRVFEFGFTTTSGSGIGLFQVKDLITNNMKGSISISSTKGNGTTVKIVLYNEN